jgi:heavy metal sensor kinase
MRRMPIRARLTAWYVLVLALVLVALGAFVVTRLRTDLTAEVDRSLRAAAGQIAFGYRAEGAPELRDVTRTVLPGPRDRGSGAQVLDRAGHVVLSDGDRALAAPLIDRATLARVLAGEEVVASRRAGSPPEHLRTVAVPVRRLDGPQALVVAESLADVDSAVHRVLVLLLVGGAAALAVIGLGGWWIARKALRPVGRMTARADRIGIDDLSQRIAVPRARDEVGDLARTLNAMLDRLEGGVAQRERLVADASHELRAPLAAMRAELEVSLRHDPLDDDARAVLASVLDEVLRMGRIVDNLLTLAQADEGRLELLAAPQELGAIAERAVRAQRAAATVAGVGLELDGEGVTVEADGDRLGQVLANLLDNAIRFAPEGGHVRVHLWSGANEAGLTVSDDGPGVPSVARERIFERFAREDPARGRSGGAGLGLAISREIVRAHGGRIWVQEHEPRGSTFVVALPLEPRLWHDGRGRTMVGLHSPQPGEGP